MGDYEAFWGQWAELRTDVSRAIETGDFTDLPDRISAAVEHIADGLTWELGPGEEARHAFCLSSNGDPDKRAAIESCLRRGPGADAQWEYHPARRPVPAEAVDNFSLQFGDSDLTFGDVRVAWKGDDDRERLDVIMHHPAFAEMPDDARLQAGFVILDNVLGEDGVERWLGGIELTSDALEGNLGLRDLRVGVDELAKTATGDRWAVLRGELEDGAPVFVTLNTALKRVDHPLFLQRLELTIPLKEPTDEGLTTDDEAGELNALEDELIEDLGDAVAYVGRETRQGLRVLHLYCAEGGPAPDAIRRFGERHPERAMSLHVERDPLWEAQGRFI